MTTAIRSAALAAALLLSPTLALTAHAQPTPVGVGSSDTITIRAKGAKIDLAHRLVTLTGPEGNSVTVKVSEDVRNLAQVRPGMTVLARYYASTVLVLSPPGVAIPEDSVTAAGARAAQGQLPGAAIGDRTVITGLVVGVDLTAHTLSLVDPKGGRVRTLQVSDPERQAQLRAVKVGDKLTVITTAALAVSVEPVGPGH